MECRCYGKGPKSKPIARVMRFAEYCREKKICNFTRISKCRKCFKCFSLDEVLASQVSLIGTLMNCCKNESMSV